MTGSLTGELAPGVLQDLLEYLRQTQASGMLALFAEAGQGRIELRAGKITHSTAGRHSGEAALQELLSWGEGRFAYEPEPATVKALLSEELLEELSLCARRLLGPIGEIFLEDAAEDLGYDDETAVEARHASALVETMAGYMDPDRRRQFLRAAETLLRRHGL